MKNFKFIAFTFLLFITSSVTACGANREIAWKDGVVIVDGKKHQVDLNLQDVDKEYVVKSKFFISGFQIDSSGVNHSTVAWFNEDYTKASYKRFENFIQSIFEYDNSIYLLESSGLVYKFANDSWELSNIKLQKDSYVIYTKNDIVACQQASLFKSSKNRGNCYSMNNGWSVDVHWYEIQPKICDSKLMAIGTIKNKKVAWRIDIETGKFELIDSVSSESTDPCSITK